MNHPTLTDTKAVIPEGLEGLYEGWHFSPALVSGDIVYLSGIIGAEADMSVNPDPEGQFVRVFETMGHTLTSAGADYGTVVDMVSYHVGLEHFPVFTEVKDRYFPEPYCAWTAIGVSSLLLPGALVEVKVVAKLKP